MTDTFKHIIKKGTLPPAFLNNTLIHLLTSYAEQPVKNPEVKKKSKDICTVEGCNNLKHVDSKRRPRCHMHQLEYLRNLARINRMNGKKGAMVKKKNAILRKKNALPK